MCVVYRTLARSTRDRPSADTGRVREVEGAGQLSLKQERTGPGQDQDRTKTKTGSCVGVRLAGRLTMRVVGLAPKLTGPIANRRWWRGWPLDYRTVAVAAAAAGGHYGRSV